MSLVLLSLIGGGGAFTGYFFSKKLQKLFGKYHEVPTYIALGLVFLMLVINFNISLQKHGFYNKKIGFKCAKIFFLIYAIINFLAAFFLSAASKSLLVVQIFGIMALAYLILLLVTITCYIPRDEDQLRNEIFCCCGGNCAISFVISFVSILVYSILMGSTFTKGTTDILKIVLLIYVGVVTCLTGQGTIFFIYYLQGQSVIAYSFDDIDTDNIWLTAIIV